MQTPAAGVPVVHRSGRLQAKLRPCALANAAPPRARRLRMSRRNRSQLTTRPGPENKQRDPCTPGPGRGGSMYFTLPGYASGCGRRSSHPPSPAQDPDEEHVAPGTGALYEHRLPVNRGKSRCSVASRHTFFITYRSSREAAARSARPLLALLQARRRNQDVPPGTPDRGRVGSSAWRRPRKRSHARNSPARLPTKNDSLRTSKPVGYARSRYPRKPPDPAPTSSVRARGGQPPGRPT